MAQPLCEYSQNLGAQPCASCSRGFQCACNLFTHCPDRKKFKTQLIPSQRTKSSTQPGTRSQSELEQGSFCRSSERKCCIHSSARTQRSAAYWHISEVVHALLQPEGTAWRDTHTHMRGFETYRRRRECMNVRNWRALCPAETQLDRLLQIPCNIKRTYVHWRVLCFVDSLT